VQTLRKERINLDGILLFLVPKGNIDFINKQALLSVYQ
jgi:hypothetical protein